MTWQQTHLRWQALKQIEGALTADPSARLWRPEHAAAFADEAELHAYLRYRWSLRLDARSLDEPCEHPARTVARMGLVALAALDRQEARSAAA